MTHKIALLDTSFFLRFLNDKDPLFKNAEKFFRHFIDNKIAMAISTISIAEYCVGGDIQELPLKNLKVIPFNVSHAKRTGEFAKIAFINRGSLQLSQRNIIPNDTKLFAQADVEVNVEYYLTSDKESEKLFQLLKIHAKPSFQFINLETPCSEAFGILDF